MKEPSRRNRRRWKKDGQVSGLWVGKRKGAGLSLQRCPSPSSSAVCNPHACTRWSRKTGGWGQESQIMWAADEVTAYSNLTQHAEDF